MTQSLYQYNNCYGILEDIRTELNEWSVALSQGSKVASYDNSDIVRKINTAQRFLWNMLFIRFPELFLTTANVTGTAGVYTNPSDLYRLSHIIDSSGNKISNISIKLKHLSNNTGSPYLYYRYGNTIVRDNGGTDTITYYYYKTVKEMTQGMSSAGGVSSLTLATTAKPVADYYNGIIIENITNGWASTISDYTAARVATLTGTGAASNYYGTVSELPECFHDLISQKAKLLLRSEIVSPEKPTTQIQMDFRENLIETIRAFTGSYYSDIPMDELFYDFNSYYR